MEESSEDFKNTKVLQKKGVRGRRKTYHFSLTAGTQQATIFGEQYIEKIRNSHTQGDHAALEYIAVQPVLYILKYRMALSLLRIFLKVYF